MTYLLSKTVGFALQPINMAILVLVLGAATMFTRFRNTGRMVTVAGVLALLVFAHSPLANLMMLPLESRFARGVIPADVTGFISLGGGIDDIVSASRHVVELESASDRVVELVVLARRYPNAKIVYSGGVSALVYEAVSSGSIVGNLLTGLGVEAERLVLEARSRNTVENARYTRELLQPKPGEKWVLITSAFHMPRAMGVFRKEGFDVIPWPVDYRTRAEGAENQWFFDAVLHLDIANLALKEWIGLTSYYVMGRTDALFPAP